VRLKETGKMSLIHILVTKLRGYDMCTLYFDDRDEKIADADGAFVRFEKEFVANQEYYPAHPEDTFGQIYFGYFIFPHFSADEIYSLYKGKCESKPDLERRYNIYFTKEYAHLEEMIKKFDMPLEMFVVEKHKFKTYSHRLINFERSIQIIRDMQTTIYETDSHLSEKQLELHKRFMEKFKK
jgi:hypothetical protein